MRYVRQADELGCFRACAAMVLDMDYSDVAKEMPLQDKSCPNEIGTRGDEAVTNFYKLAASRGLHVKDLGDLSKNRIYCEAGLRYVFFIAGLEINHAVAIDETGIVFDPYDPNSRKHWTDYQPKGALEIGPNP